MSCFMYYLYYQICSINEPFVIRALIFIILSPVFLFRLWGNQLQVLWYLNL